MNTSLPQSSTSLPVSNPEFPQVPASINNAITKCGLEIAQAVHKLGTAFANGGIEKAQAGQLVEEKHGLTKEQLDFFWRIHQTYVIAPTEAGVPVHRPYLISIDFQVLAEFRYHLGTWGRDVNRLHSNIVVEPDGIECKYPEQISLDLSRMTVQQARDFKYSSKVPTSYSDPRRDPHPEGSVVPLVAYPHDDISRLFTDEELGLC